MKTHMSFFKELPTSQKITLYFSVFNVASLILLVLVINVVYFYIWYSEIKQESLYDMNTNYSVYGEGMSFDNKKAFTEYILKKDTIIAPGDGQMVCSEWVASKLHNDEEAIKDLMDSFFYTINDKTYFVFTKEYDEIWEVSILYDTTEYLHSQGIIIKVSLVVIVLFGIINFFLWKYIARRSLKNLVAIAKEAQKYDLEKTKDFSIYLNAPEEDEIQILARTLNKMFEKITKQSENQKQFLTDVSHEFKTPLMVMSSRLDLYEKMEEKWRACQSVEIISTQKVQIKKLNKLIETLMYFSKMQLADQCILKEKIHLEVMTNKTIAEMQTLYVDKKITWEYVWDWTQMVKAESVSMQILLENLFGNACKFSKNDLKITVTHTKNWFTIEDNGKWIPEDKQKAIWEKFQRADTKIEWFGIGLFLVKRICEIHNWTITLESEEWRWTKFIIKYS